MHHGRRKTVTLPLLPPSGTALCRLDELGNPGGREFTFGNGPGALEMFIVRNGEEVFGYLNTCPHAGAPLNWTSGQFLNPSRTLIQCASHGAQFRIEDGQCVSGPCIGDSLTPIAVLVVGGNIVVAPNSPTTGKV